MDEKLMAWARAVKARRRHKPALPPLWVFTDRERLPDPCAVLAALPKALCGVVFRPGGCIDAALAAEIRRICRQRRFVLVVAGLPRLAATLQAGQHLSRGRRLSPPGRGMATSSAHGVRELVAARRAGAGATFLSPVFSTASHPGVLGLGVVRWAALARARGPVLALGGLSGSNVRRLPRTCAGVGVIGAVAAAPQRRENGKPAWYLAAWSGKGALPSPAGSECGGKTSPGENGPGERGSSGVGAVDCNE